MTTTPPTANEPNVSRPHDYHPYPIDAADRPALTPSLPDWTIQILAPTALHQIGLSVQARALAALPRWKPSLPGLPANPHLTRCRTAYFHADTCNNAEWQTSTLHAAPDGSLYLHKKRQNHPITGPTADVHELADQLGPQYFTTIGFQPGKHLNAGVTAHTRAAFYAYAATALAYQITRRRGHTLNLTTALTHPTYLALRTPER